MAARDYQLRFVLPDPNGGPDTTFVFDYQGTWRWEHEFTYKEAADDSQVEQIRAVWDLSGCAQLDSWAQLRAAFAVLHQRGGSFPTKLQIVSNPGANESVELELGPTDWEDFRVDRMSGGEEFAPAPSATHRSAFVVNVRVSAVQRFEESVGNVATGIVQFEQSEQREYENGLLRLTWDTTVTTKKGVDAAEKAKLLGLIPISALGSNYTYFGCNGDDGVSLTILDADQRASGAASLTPDRVPTKVRAVCQVRQHGVRVDVTSPGTGPDDVSLVTETKVTDAEKTRTIIAEAAGPGAEAWVRAQRPSGEFDELLRQGAHDNTFRGEWTFHEKSPKAELTYVVKGELTGGYQAPDFEPVTGGLPPVDFWSPVLPWELTLTIELQRRGDVGAMNFPPQLPAPWRLDPSRSHETEAFEAEAAATPAKALWKRTASLVYVSPVPPSEAPVAWIRKEIAAGSGGIDTYWLHGDPNKPR